MKSIATLLSGLLFSAGAAADVFYDWVQIAGSGPSSGFIRFADTNIADPANFAVTFNAENVLEVQFTFSDGVTIADATNFDPSTTLQNDPALNQSRDFVAMNGVMNDGWSFLKGPSKPDLEYVSTTEGGVLCVTQPCPLTDVAVSFIGPNIPRASSTGEWHLRPVPLPAPVVLLVSALGLLVSRRRPARSRDRS